jgi:hypothetical protein
MGTPTSEDTPMAMEPKVAHTAPVMTVDTLAEAIELLREVGVV